MERSHVAAENIGEHRRMLRMKFYVTASITDKLGKDGKLTLQERQCCFDNNLCMFCGSPGHSAKYCLKSSSSASKSKAQAIQAKGKEAKESSDSKKRLSSPQPSTQPEDCVDPSCAFSKVVQLNVSALSDPNSLHVSLTSLLISNSSLHVSALIDSGSTHCFVDTSFVQYYKLPAYLVDPIELKLFDGTSNSIITQSVALPVKFPSGECMNVNFYVTLLNLSCSVVLGYNWLTATIH